LFPSIDHTLVVLVYDVLLKHIVEDLPIAQSTVSQHLKELKQSGLIKGEIDGTSVCYCIDESEWKKATQLLRSFFEGFELNGNTCC
jgi:DNA-binding transcriptional ArsR family regulator